MMKLCKYGNMSREQKSEQSLNQTINETELMGMYKPTYCNNGDYRLAQFIIKEGEYREYYCKSCAQLKILQGKKVKSYNHITNNITNTNNSNNSQYQQQNIQYHQQYQEQQVNKKLEQINQINQLINNIKQQSTDKQRIKTSINKQFEQLFHKIDKHYQQQIDNLLELKEQKIKRTMEMKQYYDYKQMLQEVELQENEKNIYMIEKDIEDNFENIIDNEFQIQDFDRVMRGYMDRLLKIQKQNQQSGCYQQMFQQVNCELHDEQTRIAELMVATQMQQKQQQQKQTIQSERQHYDRKVLQEIFNNSQNTSRNTDRSRNIDRSINKSRVANSQKSRASEIEQKVKQKMEVTQIKQKMKANQIKQKIEANQINQKNKFKSLLKKVNVQQKQNDIFYNQLSNTPESRSKNTSVVSNM